MRKKYFSRATILWCTSYFLLLTIFFASVGIMSALNRSIIKKINDKYCQEVLSSISENTKNAISVSQRLYFSIVNDSDASEVIRFNSQDEYFTSSKVKAFLKNLARINDEMDFYIYIPHTKMILTKNGCFDAELYYEIKCKDSDISFEQWLKNFTKGSKEVFVSFPDKESKDIVIRDKHVFLNGREMIILTTFDENFIFDTAKKPEWITSGDIYVSNLKGEIYLSKRKSGNNTEIKNNADIAKYYSNNWHIVEKTEMSALPMIITIVYSKSIMLKEVKMFNTIQIIFIIVSFLLSSVVIFFAVRRNYKPISSILDKLNISESKNEYEDIEKRIGKLMDEYTYYAKRAKKFDADHVHEIVSKCMTGNYSVEYTRKQFEENNIVFAHKSFVLCYFEISDIADLFGDFEHTHLPKEEKFKELTFILDNVISELFNAKDCGVYVISIGEDIFALINTCEDNSSAEGNVYKTIKNALDFIKNNFYIGISFALSDVYNGAGYMSKAYHQVKYLMKYKHAAHIEKPICVDDMQTDSSVKIAALFNVEIENKLINCIISGNIEGADNTINYIFSELEDIKPSLEQIQCLMVDLGCILYKIPQDAVKIDFGKILEYSATSGRMKQFLKDTAREICSKTQMRFKKVDKVADIKSYIDENYRENMDLSTLANQFDISSSYLSRHFKSVAGVALPDYINRTRLYHAKELLKNSSKPIKDIAISVGYENMRSFNRIFQKYEGMSPSYYRNSIK